MFKYGYYASDAVTVEERGEYRVRKCYNQQRYYIVKGRQRSAVASFLLLSDAIEYAEKRANANK
jgi:hypothetical protein